MANTVMVPTNCRQSDSCPHTMRGTSNYHWPADKHKGPIRMEHVRVVDSRCCNSIGRTQNYRREYVRPFGCGHASPVDCASCVGRMVEHQDSLGLDFRAIPEGAICHLDFLCCRSNSLQPVSERKLHQRLVSHPPRNSCWNRGSHLCPLARGKASDEVFSDCVLLA